MARNTKSKRSSKSGKKQPQKKKTGGLRGFYRGTMGELRKVSWPTRREARGLTGVVILVMVAMALFLGGFDFLFFQFFDMIWSVF